ncbi:MAG: ChbG/HpnK family deacetylase [Candidatus Moraniibacteriota bacterium]
MPDLDKKIIVSADDFGQNPTANANILELLLLRKLQRISVMIDGKFSPEEIHCLIDSQVKIDLHLDLFGLSKNSQALRKKTGVLSRLWVFFRDYLSGKIRVSEVEKDWVRQLEKFRIIFGKYPDGLNSHEHIHFFPPYFKLILTLAEKLGINYLRLGKKDFVQTNSIVSWIIFYLRKINRRYFLASGLTSADFLISLDWLQKDSLKKINPSCGEIELIVHPERMAELEFLKTQTILNF